MIRTVQKVYFSIKGNFSKCDRIRRFYFLQIWSPLLKKSLMEYFVFCAMLIKIKTIIFSTSNNTLIILNVSFIQCHSFKVRQDDKKKG